MALHDLSDPRGWGTLATQYLAMGTTLALILLAVAELPRLRAFWRERPSIAWTLTGLMTVALLLRLGAPAGPMDLHFRLNAALIPMDRAHSAYGMAFPSMVRMLWWVTGPSDRALFTMNAVLGALSVGLLYGLGRSLSLGAAQALVAAAALATAPVHIRFSHTDIQTVTEVALFLWGMSRWIAPSTAVDRVTAALAIGLAAAMRPEAPALLVFACASAWVVERRLVRADLAAGLVLVPSLTSILGWIGVLGSDSASAAGAVQVHRLPLSVEQWIVFDPQWTSIAVTTGLFLMFFADRPSRGKRIWLIAVTFGLSALVLHHPHSPGEMVLLRHQVRAVPWLCLVAGVGLGPAFAMAHAHSRAALAVAVSLCAGLTAPTTLSAYQRVTLNHEYDFVATAVAQIPDGCEIFAVYNPWGRDVALDPPWQLSTLRGKRHRWRDLARSAVEDGGCRVYYRGSSCQARPVHAEPVKVAPGQAPPLHKRCAEAEAELALSPIQVTRIPGQSYGLDAYPEGALLEIGFFAIDDSLMKVDPVPRARPDKAQPHTPSPAPRQGIADDIAALPQVEPPPEWVEAEARAALSNDSACPPVKIRCAPGVCVAVSAAGGCDRETWAADAALPGGAAVMRSTWEDQHGSKACALIALDSSDFGTLQRRAGLMAEQTDVRSVVEVAGRRGVGEGRRGLYQRVMERL